MSVERDALGFLAWQGAADAAPSRDARTACGDATGILRADAPAILARVRDPWVGLALWRRTMPEAIARALDALPVEGMPHGRILAPSGQLAAPVDWLLQGCDLAGTPLGGFLRTDILDIARRFAGIVGTDLVDLRLETIHHDACWKFHRDNVRWRLISTYRGPGTQIVAPDLAARALGEQRDYGGPLEELPRFSVALFKGIRTARPEDGIVHRSPPIAGSGQTRLVLCLNERSEVSPPLWNG